MADSDKDNWIAPVLFGLAALSIYGIARASNQPQLPFQTQEKPMNEKSEFAALMHYSHEIHNHLDNFLIEHSELRIKIPDEYVDPVTLQLMEDPVMLSDYQTYNRKTALLLLKYKKNSPVVPTHQLLEDFIEDKTELKECIESWLTALNLQYDKSFKIRC